MPADPCTLSLSSFRPLCGFSAEAKGNGLGLGRRCVSPDLTSWSAPSYAFNPVIAMPWMKYFDAKRYTSTTGPMVIIEPAAHRS